MRDERVQFVLALPSQAAELFPILMLAAIVRRCYAILVEHELRSLAAILDTGAIQPVAAGGRPSSLD